MSFNTPAKKGKSSLIQAPSTTPNVPPPTWLTQKSTTPAGNPPESSRIFGSSFANNTFGNRYARPKGGFAVPESSPPPSDEEDADADAEAEEDEDEAEEMDIGELDRGGKSPVKSAFMSSIGQSPRGLKRSRNGQPREGGHGDMADIARGMVRNLPSASISESDDVVCRTEAIVSTLSNDHHQAPQRADESATTAAAQLSRLWAQHCTYKTKDGSIGPANQESLTEATYLASLVIQTHIPHSTRPSQPPPVARPNRSLAQSKQPSPPASLPMPRALLDWLDAHHKPFPDDFNRVHMYRPSPSANDSFWDVVFAELVRGKLTHTVRLLRDAGWENAVTAQDDGSQVAGYQGPHLEYTEEVVDRCISVLDACPALRDQNWDVKGTEWQLFRRRVKHAMQELDALAREERDPDELDDELGGTRNIFARSNMSLSASTTRANSRVPWAIYENLIMVYRILIGDEITIVDTVQDWLEAAIVLTVWWDGEPTDSPTQLHASLRQARRANASPREVDVAPLSAYRRRLSEALNFAIDSVDDFDLDTLDPVQVGLVCVLEDDIEGAVGIIRTMSPTVTATIVDLAELGGWLPRAGQAKSRGMLQQEGFSSEDLMVLSHGVNNQKALTGKLDHDEILGEYADMLSEREVFEASDASDGTEGWELAVSVLGRLDDKEVAQAKIAEIFEQMEFDDANRVDKVLDLCGDMGLSEQARGISERYADSLANFSPSGSQSQRQPVSYGPALIYYARAHATAKIRSTLSLLASLCLLQSAATPIDETLTSLLSKERTALLDLARVDSEAATLLASNLSGYATLRRFYELRDQTQRSSTDHRVDRPLEGKRLAACALIAAIESASDCIRGGLFDPTVGAASAVPVDGLLALLGEALPLLNQDKRIFTQAQVFALLRVVEDLDTVSARIKEACDALCTAALHVFRGDWGGAQQQKTGSSGSGLSGSGSWEMIVSQTQGGSDDGVERAWDWRKGLDAVAGPEVRSWEVLILLRAALAREVASGWSGGLNW